MDATENIRREMVQEINSAAIDKTRADFEAEYGRVWNTSELGTDFEVLGFMAPFVVVKRKADGAKGSLMFAHSPRFYFSFTED